MRIFKEALEVAGQGADNVFANVKINIGEILSIDEKLEKYNETAYQSARIFGCLIRLAGGGILKTLTKVYPADTT